MIFVTVGTHEQQFNRLIEYMDNWAKVNEEKVIMQTGYSTYVPKYAECKELYSYDEINSLVKDSRIVITHGGPSSFIMALQYGKIPIVVPRKVDFNEHVNNHQVDFCKEVSIRKKNIILVENINELGEVIEKYNDIVRNMNNEIESNNKLFCLEIEKIVNNLVN